MNLRERVNSKIFVDTLISHFKMRANASGFMVCPFHSDSRPSFKVYGKEKGWFCFQCQRGGGAVEFLAYLKRCSFEMATKALAKKWGISEQTDFANLSIATLSDEERARLEQASRHSFFIGWQRQKCIDFFAELEKVPSKYKEFVYDAWYNFGIPHLERYRYLYLTDGSSRVLDKYVPEFKDFIKSKVHCWRYHAETGTHSKILRARSDKVEARTRSA
jgi:hypothetical protein